jgi:hypothetical protein
MDDAAEGMVTPLEVSLDGAPRDCRLGVGFVDQAQTQLAQAPITRPADADWQMASADGGWLYTRATAHPLVRLVSDWSPERSRSAALEAAVDPARTASDPLPVAFADAPPTGASGGEVDSWSADDHGVSASVTSDGPSLVVAAFNAAPGWTVTVDGKDAELVEPDGAFLGVQVPAGDHRVRFEYAPPGLKAGAALTLVGLLAVAATSTFSIWWPRVRRLRRGAEGARRERTAGGGSPGTPAAAAPD